MKVVITLIVLFFLLPATGQEICSKELQSEMKKYETKKLRGRLNRSAISSEVRSIKPLSSDDARWSPFIELYFLDLDDDGDYEVVGRYLDPAYENYRNRLVVLNAFSSGDLEKIIDDGDVTPQKFVSDSKMLDLKYLYSASNDKEILSYALLGKALSGYVVSYKEIVEVKGKYYVVVAASVNKKSEYFLFTLDGFNYASFCRVNF